MFDSFETQNVYIFLSSVFTAPVESVTNVFYNLIIAYNKWWSETGSSKETLSLIPTMEHLSHMARVILLLIIK